MKAQRLAVAVTVVNLLLMGLVLAQRPPAVAQDVTPVLRGRALEIVDSQGRVRASIKVQPAGAMPNGTPYPETVILRLIDPNGRPEVKLAASVKGAGLGLVGETDSTYIVLQAEGADSHVKLISRDGGERIIRP